MDRDLLLAEELLLLSLDDEKGSDQTWSSLDGGLAGALLLELTEDGALRLDGDDKLVPGASAPADPLLAEARGRHLRAGLALGASLPIAILAALVGACIGVAATTMMGSGGTRAP
jgi:hypothetical protein